MDLRLGKGVQEVIQLGRDDSGKRTASTLYRKKKRKKKGTWGLNQLGKVVRAMAASQQVFADSYMSEHDESSRKKQDGWLRDMPYNVYRAGRRGAKKLRAISPLPLPGEGD